MSIQAREMEKCQEKRNFFKACFDTFGLGTKLVEEDEFPVTAREGIPESWTNEKKSPFAK